jgi:hypothetical protein
MNWKKQNNIAGLPAGITEGPVLPDTGEIPVKDPD